MNKNDLLRSVGLSLLAISAALLMGCGQKGPLTLPKAPQAGAGAASAPAGKP